MNKIRTNMIMAIIGCLMFGLSFTINNTELKLSEPLRTVITESNKAVDEVNDYMEKKIKRDITKVGLSAGVAGAIVAGAAHFLVNRPSRAKIAAKYTGAFIALLGFGAAVVVQ